MARDYFDDITPPSDDLPARKLGVNQYPAEDEIPAAAETPVEEMPQARSIRSIQAPARRPRPMPPPRAGAGLPPRPPKRRTSRTRWFMWGVATILLLGLGGLALLALRPTTVTVIPKSHTVFFDDSSQFVTYPASLAATGTLAYTVQTIDLEDSEVVAAQGTTTKPPAKASGTITVVNNYSTDPVRLIKNTRFETPDGLVFRTPTEIVVPGKKGSTPGQVDVTVAADATGAEYNIGPTARFTLPGLKSSPDMYTTVYAKSSRSMAGGSSGGTEPAVAPATLAAAISAMKARLDAQAREAMRNVSNDTTTVLPELAQFTYQELPSTQESDGNVRLHEGVHVMVPVFSADDFAQAIASQVSADAGATTIALVPGAGFGAKLEESDVLLGNDSVSFTLTGQGQLVWRVDAQALSEALAGRDGAAFQTIVNGFPGIQEAHARIEPFWSSAFPAKASDIHVAIETPQAGQ